MPETKYLEQSFTNFGVKSQNYSSYCRPEYQLLAPPESTYHYARVYVLLFHWADDDLGVFQEVHDLAKVFFEICQFTHVKVAQIPRRYAHAFVDSELRNFTGRYSSPNNLLIVYYSGHGSLDARHRLNWWAKRDSNDSKPVRWYELQTGLQYSRSDVLILLDSCCSAGSIKTSSGVRGGRTELIAASGFESDAYGPSPNSFTTVLMEVLISTIRSLRGRQRQNFSITDLHEKILSRLVRRCRPGATSTPVYVKLRGAPSKPSIPLRCLNSGVGGPKRVHNPKRYL